MNGLRRLTPCPGGSIILPNHLQRNGWRDSAAPPCQPGRRWLRRPKVLASEFGLAFFIPILGSPYSVFDRRNFQVRATSFQETAMVRQWMLLPLLGLVFAVQVFASGPTGTITGTVTDSSGALVRKARITVLNVATNAIRTAETNEDGDYTVALLPPGRYRVTAENPGFRRTVFNDVTVDVDQP